MKDITIKTNGHYKELLCWEELTFIEKKEFDYCGTEASSFFRYKGCVYSLEDFMRLPPDNPFKGGWEGYHGESFFSGILVKYSDCGDGVKVATYFS